MNYHDLHHIAHWLTNEHFHADSSYQTQLYMHQALECYLYYGHFAPAAQAHADLYAELTSGARVRDAGDDALLALMSAILLTRRALEFVDVARPIGSGCDCGWVRERETTEDRARRCESLARTAIDLACELRPDLADQAMDLMSEVLSGTDMIHDQLVTDGWES